MSAKKTPETSGKPPARGRKQPQKTATSAKARGKAGDPAPPAALPRLRKLTTYEGVMHELRTVYRAARSGLLPPATATRLTFILNSLSAGIAASTFEQRLSELEKRHHEAAR